MVNKRSSIRKIGIRWVKFNAVGTAGLVVQFSLLALLLHIVKVHYLWATALSLETAILHKYFWHRRWTWADRGVAESGRAASAALLRFNLLSLISLGGNLVSAWVLTGFWKLDPLVANLLFLLPSSLANFFITDKFVFVAPPGERLVR